MLKGRVEVKAAVSSEVEKQRRLSCKVETRCSKHVDRMNCSPEGGAMVMISRSTLSLSTAIVVVVPNWKDGRPGEEGCLRMDGKRVWEDMMVGEQCGAVRSKRWCHVT